MVEFKNAKSAAKKVLARVGRADGGMTTAEYAVGTVGAIGIGGVLALLTMPDGPINILPIIEPLVRGIIDFIKGLIDSGGNPFSIIPM
ncbi:MAG: DUF4244 domain-containing protein [Propionibacteriaceae bacterium]|nr:DUF4244 domain-containing protein [Propionibacteriaceae bacterium]